MSECVCLGSSSNNNRPSSNNSFAIVNNVTVIGKTNKRTKAKHENKQHESELSRPEPNAIMNEAYALLELCLLLSITHMLAVKQQQQQQHKKKKKPNHVLHFVFVPKLLDQSCAMSTHCTHTCARAHIDTHAHTYRYT